MTPDELRALCVEWQTLLRLQDWDIEVRQVPFDELEDGRSGGNIEFLDVKRKAVLRLLDPRYQRQKTLVPYDEEYTLVHELVHIHLRAWPGNDDGATEAEEIAVHRISEALLKLKRRAGSHDCLPFLKQMETAAIALGEIESGEALREQEARRLALRL